MRQKLGAIFSELEHHAPFTLIGATSGIVCMLLFRNAPAEVSHRLFLVFHPGHVILSAIVTTSLFRLYDKRAGLLKIVVIGYLGSIGVATVSDCVLPFFGENILGVALPSHAAIHDHEAEPAEERGTETASTTQVPGIREHLHLGFIEDWYVVNPAAILGIIIAYFWPRTRFPHAGHVLISTWASSFHVLMNTHRELTPMMFVGIFIVLFIAVWLPCCVSDIIFPLLFVKSAPLCTHHPRKTETAL